MARPCAICSHPERDEIEAAIIAGGSFRSIATRYGMTNPSVLRHRNSHMAEQLAAAAAQRQATETESLPSPPSSTSTRTSADPQPQPSRRQDVAEALDIVAQLKAVNGSALEVLQGARRAGDGRLVLLAIDRVQKQIELQARLIGQIDERPQVSIWLSVEWQTIEQVLLDVLSHHPQARYEVSERLNALRAV